MNDTKFSMNALLVVVLVFSAIAFFFTVKVVDMADRFPVNEFYEIEDSGFGVRYSSLEPNGIYKGIESACTLAVEGSYGYDWGMALEGDDLYINEYVMTDVGLMLCDLVKIDLKSYSKEVISHNTILRGRCRSGELVCIEDFIMPSNNPKVNSLCKFYSMSSSGLDPGSSSGVVTVIDPKTSEVLVSLRDEAAQTDEFEEKYLGCTLDEIRSYKEAA